MDVQKYIDQAISMAVSFGPSVVMAILMLVVGFWVIGRISSIMASTMEARGIDESIRPFFQSLAEAAMKVVLLLAVAGKLGIETTSFIAIFSAMALAIGFALQGSLGNFASGVMILVFRPFKVGDLLTTDERTGVVEEIQIFNTIMRTPNNKKIIVPNGKVTEGAMETIAFDEPTRVDILMHVEEDTSINMVRAVVQKVCNESTYTIKDKSPVVNITGYPMAAAELCIGFWANGIDYVDCYHDMQEKIKIGFDQVGITLSKEDRAED